MDELKRLVVAGFVVAGLMLMPTVILAEDDFDDPDPWIGLNTSIMKFNDKADALVLRPVAKGYQAVLPSFVRRSVGNAFGNIEDLNISLNNLLQGKPGAALSDMFRVVINTTLGIGGLFDPASGIGLQKHNESFGQTLSVWGVPSGPYLVVPLLGPSSLTDTLSRPLDSAMDPLRYLYPVDHRNRLYGTRVIDGRASLLGAEGVIFGDRYRFIRDAYLQRREYLVKDGAVRDAFDDF